ncbi:serine/threonine protein kinase [Nocardia amikacinitolerans]|uniref:serine/threonine-protein kinase n=1 Tax=Nocardia amikacinitolerans TaxID=756689 RepID=UPI00082FEA44|nr:serine/threonine-protein kinase [Nocardia amikacinitolerans]MCP2316272.1 serine/threonine protein kinase [Nocardia amikacinitolerans]
MQGVGLAVGEVFAGYRIERVLGRGGMGTVYLAGHPRLPRLIALKLLDRELYADEEARRRFEREADVVARLDHPNIVSVLDRGADDGVLWISMQYVDGGDASAFRGRPLDPARAAGIVAQTAAALDYAHDRGVLHRDVKPANILLSAAHGGGDRVLLSDFGIARMREDTHQLTKTGELLATLAYAAPEQLSDETVDQRADQYALGCTLFALLTGRAPFTATNPGAIIAAHLTQPVPKASALVPGLPPAVDEVIARAMDKDPARRFAGCGDFAEVAARALGGRAAAPMLASPVDDSAHPRLAPSHALLDGSAPSRTAHFTNTPTDAHGAASPWGSGSAPVIQPPRAPHPADAGIARQPATTRRWASDPTMPPRRPGRQVSSGWRTFSVLLLVSALVLGLGGVAAVGVYWKIIRPNRPQPLPWGAHHSIAVKFPELIPASPDGTGWRGARCHAAATVVTQPGDPLPLRQIVCTDPDGVTAWYTEYGGFRDVQAYLSAHATLTGEREFSRPGGLQVFRPTDPAAPFALATHGWVAPMVSSILVEVAWPGHTYEEVRDLWWAQAPF